MSGVDIIFDGPGRYSVITNSRVDTDVLDFFVMETIQNEPLDEVQGWRYVIDIKDQSELMGFLNTLYNRHYAILKVEYIPSRDPSPVIKS